MILKELDFLLGSEAIESSGFETGESTVGWGQNGQSVGGVELVFDLINDLGFSKEADEDAEAAGLVKDLGDVWGCRLWRLAWRGMNEGLL